MSPSQFQAAAKRLFGRGKWSSRTLRYLDVSPSTMWNWSKGIHPVPVMAELALKYEELRRQVEAQPQPVLAHSIEILLRAWLDRNWSAIARGAMPELGPLERDLRTLFKEVE